MTIVLLEPQIPPNTGNIARLCAATNTRLEIVGKIGFELTDRYLKRAGLDYWDYLDWEYYKDIDEYMARLDETAIHLFTTKTAKSYTDIKFCQNDRLVFGSELTGISDEYRKKYTNRLCTIPMYNKNVRSLNLSSATAIVLYEAIRQLG